MRITTKLLLAGIVTVAAIAISAAPSEAAKRKSASAKCTPQVTDCSVCKPKSNSCELKTCGSDGKLYDNLIARICIQPNCPKAC